MDTLARYRTINARQSPTVVRLGRDLLATGTRLGSQEWAVREQIAVAALDVGDVQLAESQIALLSARFPSSPRLVILQALHLESRGKYTSAKIIYHALLGRREGVVVEGGDDGAEGRQVVALWKGQSDECLVTAHQRLITLDLYPDGPRTPTPDAIAAAIPRLVSYLDVFHQDPDAWSLLADLYVLSSPGCAADEGWGVDALWAEGVVGRAACGKGKGGYLEQGMECLAQRVLLEPWEWKVLARFAEIGMLQGDIPFAYKTLLRAVEMSSVPYPGGNDPTAGDDDVPRVTDGMGWKEIIRVGGWKTRVWWDLAVSTSALEQPCETNLSPEAVEKVAPVAGLVRTRLEALTGRKGVVEDVLGQMRREG